MSGSRHRFLLTHIPWKNLAALCRCLVLNHDVV